MTEKKIGFVIEIDEAAIAPATPNTFIYQLLNRLSYEHKITEITIDDVTVKIDDQAQIEELILGEDKDLK